MTIAQNVEAAIVAQNIFTEWMDVSIDRRYSVSIWGTFVGTVTLQKSYDGGATILDIEEFNSPASDVSVPVPENLQVRIGVKTGDYTSGTVNVRLGGK